MCTNAQRRGQHVGVTTRADNRRYAFYWRGDVIPDGEGTSRHSAKCWACPRRCIETGGDIRSRVVEPAIAEVNQIADFVASYRLEHGPRNKVVAVELWFLPKDTAGRNAAAAELNRSRVGRKARRVGTVEMVAPSAGPLAWPEVSK
jgi:hypothetical protein